MGIESMISLSGMVMTPVFAAGLPLAAINWHSVLFLLFASLARIFAVGVVLADNVVRMALYLVFSLAATAGLFFLAGAEFIGAMQLMIYVGGTLVLLVFGVMLTAQAPFVSIKPSAADRALAGLAGSSLLVVLLAAALSVDSWQRPGRSEVTAPTATPLGMALLGMRVDGPAAGAATGAVANGYLLPFEIVSIHLLVVLVGAAYLARAKRRRTPRPIDAAASAVSVVEGITRAELPAALPPRSGSASALVSGGSK